MIEHHVQDHFDAGLVKGADHFLELHRLLAQTSRIAVGGFGRTEEHGIVSPVIPEQLICLRIPARHRSFIKLLHGHQLHRRHPKAFEIGNLFRQTSIGSRMVHTRLGMNGEAADMHLINDSPRPRMPGRPVSIPLVRLVDKNAFRHRAGIVQLAGNQILTRGRRAVSTRGCKIPRRQPRNRGREGIEK